VSEREVVYITIEELRRRMRWTWWQKATVLLSPVAGIAAFQLLAWWLGL
jgi:hypothetical protein